jgi:hypothetical protein
MEKELAQRENDGVIVTLFWHALTDRLLVSVRDRRTGDSFDLDAEARDAMDVFHHPYAYAARRGDALGAPVFA